MRWNATTKGLLGLALAHAVLECNCGVWPVFKHLAGLDLYWAGAIATFTMATASLLQPAFGHWADGGRARKMVVFGTGLTLLMALLGPLHRVLSDSHPVLLYAAFALLIMIARLGHSMFHPAGALLTGDLFHGNRALGLGYFAALGWAGYGLSQVTFSEVYVATGGHSELLLLLSVPLVAAVALWCPRDKPHEESNRDSIRTKARAFWGMRRSVGLLFAATTLVCAANMGLFFLFPELLASKGYTGWIVNGGAFAFLVAGMAAGVLVGGHLAEHFGMRALLLLSVALNFAVFEAFVQVGALPVPLLLAVCGVAGTCMGLVQPLPVALGQALEPRNASLVSGLLMGWTWVLGSFSPLVVAFLARELGTSDALSVYGLLNLAALGCTMALVRRLPSLTGPAGAA